MKTPKERLSKRVQMAVQRDAAGFPTISAAGGEATASSDAPPVLPMIAAPMPMSLEERLELEAEGGALVRNILLNLDEEKRDTLLEMCERECLQAVIRPFGVGRILFEDKIGGNVDTVHNVRSDVYATSKEKKAYEERGKYNSDPYHQDKRYIDANRKTTAAQEAGALANSYSDKTIGRNEKKILTM